MSVSTLGGWRMRLERVLLELVGNCITPLCRQPGRVLITFSRIYFQPFNVVSNNPIQTYPTDKVRALVAMQHSAAHARSTRVSKVSLLGKCRSWQ